eukprot:CAMPEP_0194216776 /NCGR_PEP_ID=MMETSP0156-20130528/19643_1 /TAXON_ID=33649 /ORGANISM="Thalassionema nitzschioides, Strain L26-B" /LENGTH=744 /DNA_ID=CAMNT_0038945617 /DNA_START=88 /DNA_END=2322 /DNA_ORIENTATION=-
MLRASNFCRAANPAKVEVLIHETQASNQRDLSTVYGSVDIFIKLSVKNGDVIWLFNDDNTTSIRIPAVLRIDNEIDDIKILKVPAPLHYLDGPSCTIQACTNKVGLASTITVRPLGRPVSPLNLVDSNNDESSTFPEIDSNPRLVFTSTLVSVISLGQVFVYQVTDTMEAPCWTNADTKWQLEALPPNMLVQRLPPLHRVQAFLEIKKIQVRPHPTIEKVKREIKCDANALPSHKIRHVIGSAVEHHVEPCVQIAAQSLGMRYLKVKGLSAFANASGKNVTTGSIVDKLSGCQSALESAARSAPCVLHLVNLDDEFPKDDEALRHMLELRLLTMLTNALRVSTLSEPDSNHVAPLVVVLSTRKPLLVGPLQQGLVFSSVQIDLPDKLYAEYLWNDEHTFLHACEYLIGRSAHDICKWKRLYLSSKEEVTEFLRKEVLKSPSSQSSKIPNIHWQDIGGLHHVREEIVDAIELPLKHPKLFQGVSQRSGILLYGPPGTGKTLVAKAVATECGLPFFSVKGPELLGSYVGESESNVRKIFQVAREAAEDSASVLFFDELDSLAPRRGGLGDGGGVMERVVATLVTELDRPSENIVFLIGATNRPDLLDPSILRPGRLDRRVYLGLAEKREERAQVLAALTRKFRFEQGDHKDIALEVVDEFPQNLSGADFSAIASGALMRSLQRLCMKAEQQVTSSVSLDEVLNAWGEFSPVVTTNDLIMAAKDIVPSVTQDDLQRYQRLREEYSST